jgi:hypothetical protein
VRGVVRERVGRGGGVVQERGGSGRTGQGVWERERESRRRECEARLRKMVYGKKFRKPFSVFYQRVFRSTKLICRLTNILQRNKHP